MDNKTIRIRTTPGVDKNIMVELNQDFDFIEILSLKISQTDIYRSFCADYGVLIGRVISNKGFGVPNAKVSVFIPITSEDEKNDLIRQLYPYKTVSSKNDSGYRYNLFLDSTTCSINQSIGTFPTKEEVIVNDIQLEIFDKYYRYTTKTNNAGDYILFGVPTGQQTIHMDVDLSDIGLLSLRPYDFIEKGFPEKLFDGYTKFKISDNLDELPQVKTQSKGVDIVPFWGDSEICNFGITRVDFDTGIEITPSAVFMGSVFTDIKKNDLSQRCGPKNDMGEQCELTARSGVIDVLRVIYDDNGNPYEIEEYTPVGDSGTIDDDGTFTMTLPMYYDRLVTDEFGNLVGSTEPEVGVPTKGKYRFKLKLNEPGEAKKRTSASLIVPSLNRIHGGTIGTEQQRWVGDLVTNIYNDANQPPPSNLVPVLFGGTETPESSDPANIPLYAKTVASDLDLDFHTFEWKQVYTLSHFIKKYKKGTNRFSYIGIKGCDECDYNNPFPYTTAIKDASFNFFFVNLFIKLVSAILKIFIILANIRFCFSYRLTGGSDCNQILNFAPFSFITSIINSLAPLSCGDTDYFTQDNPFQCAGSGCGCTSGCDNGNAACCKSSDGGCDCTGPCIGFTIYVPSENNCSSLAELEQWKCCSILQAAKENNAIKLTFFDAWLNGSAYLFQFKASVKRKNDGTIKYKFCGPGSDNAGGDRYDFPSTSSNQNCTNGQCLVMGPSVDENDKNYIGGTNDINGPMSTPGVVNGARDTGEFIYCNWVSSTKIISLGPIEMCEDTYSDIQNCIYRNTENLAGNTTLNCEIADLRLGNGVNPYEGDNYGTISPYSIPSPGVPLTWNPPQVIKVGTGGESGFDRQETVRKLDDTSYVEPDLVLIYFLAQNNCSFGDLFIGINSGLKCHEYELEPEVFEQIREVCKIHNTLVEIPPPLPGGGYDLDAPGIWDFNGIASTIDPAATDGPFDVDLILRDRYNPNLGNQSGYSPTSPLFTANSHIDPKTNMPYFYFGLIPGKTALDKFKEKYLVNL